MVKDSIDVLGLLRKRGVEGDVDFLREALAVLVQAMMEAEVTEQVGAGYGERVPTSIASSACSATQIFGLRSDICTWCRSSFRRRCGYSRRLAELRSRGAAWCRSQIITGEHRISGATSRQDQGHRAAFSDTDVF